MPTRDRPGKAGCEAPARRTPEQIATTWKADFVRYGKLVHEAGIKAES